MKRASKFFTEEQKKRINDAVAAAEGKTSAEIVPVVARASGRYDRPEDVVGLLLGMVCLVLAWLLVPPASKEPGSWGTMAPMLRLLCLIGAVMVGFIVGALLAAQIGALRRVFTPRSQMAEEVGDRARRAFFEAGVRNTAGATGILIYVSLYERMASVFADQAALDKLGQKALDELRDQLVSGLKERDAATALCETVQTAGEKLAGVLPRADDDAKELPDTLVTID